MENLSPVGQEGLQALSTEEGSPHQEGLQGLSPEEGLPAQEGSGGLLAQEGSSAVSPSPPPAEPAPLTGPFFAEAFAAVSDDPRTRREALQRDDADAWQQAMDEVIAAMVKQGVFRLELLPPGRRAVRSLWVFKVQDKAQRQRLRRPQEGSCVCCWQHSSRRGGLH